MKYFYEPSIKVVKFDTEDVITTSDNIGYEGAMTIGSASGLQKSYRVVSFGDNDDIPL
jgi:hypothetical protein